MTPLLLHAAEVRHADVPHGAAFSVGRGQLGLTLPPLVGVVVAAADRRRPQLADAAASGRAPQHLSRSPGWHAARQALRRGVHAGDREDVSVEELEAVSRMSSYRQGRTVSVCISWRKCMACSWNGICCTCMRLQCKLWANTYEV